jgi:hypothetical protein
MMTDLRKAEKRVFELLEIVQGDLRDATEILRQALAQPEQEPKFGACVTCGALLEDQIIKQTPKREWVGLSKEEMLELFNKYDGKPFSLMLATLDKVEEKNSG